jgi:hypothetical protein
MAKWDSERQTRRRIEDTVVYRLQWFVESSDVNLDRSRSDSEYQNENCILMRLLCSEAKYTNER